MFNIYSKNLNGHRLSYVNLIKKELNGECVNVTRGLISKKPLFFLMVEDDFIWYFIFSVIRRLLGLKTVGLVFGAKVYTSSLGYKNKIKYCMLKFLNKFNFSENISIIPNYIDNRFNEICSSWIYDPQFWDYSDDLCRDNYKQLVVGDDIKALSFSDLTISSIGEQSVKKGVINFFELSNRFNYCNKVKFIFAGKLDKQCSEYYTNNQVNAKGVNRFITDDEITHLYNKSNLIWCCYHESYDQASGIFGRAIQFGKPVIVRKNSCLNIICEHEGIPHITNDELDELNELDVERISIDHNKIILETIRRKKMSVSKLKEMLC